MYHYQSAKQYTYTYFVEDILLPNIPQYFVMSKKSFFGGILVKKRKGVSSTMGKIQIRLSFKIKLGQTTLDFFLKSKDVALPLYVS